nr:DUF4126 family protein [Acidobacteriota bacterium]
MDTIAILGTALGAAWTSGINLYATVAVLGLLQRYELVGRLPGGLEALDNWWVIGVALALYAVEFVADKVPYVDTVWDAAHTFVRVPAGAVLGQVGKGFYHIMWELQGERLIGAAGCVAAAQRV